MSASLVQRQNILYLNVFDDRLHNLQHDNQGIEIKGALSTKKRLLVQKVFEEYRETGGFPEVAGLGRNLRTKTLQEYFHTTNPKKIFCIGHALVSSVSSGILVNSGHLLENLVFTALRRFHPPIFFGNMDHHIRAVPAACGAAGIVMPTGDKDAETCPGFSAVPVDVIFFCPPSIRGDIPASRDRDLPT